jgi:hypothetical protein
MQRREKSGQVMRFELVLHSTRKEDTGRVFVLAYFLEDDTVAIREPPMRNSGHVGGNFLFRKKVKKSEAGGYLEAHDLHIGATVRILGCTFELAVADEYTLRFMEEQPEAFPYSDPARVVAKLADSAESLSRVFITGDAEAVTFDDLAAAVAAVGVELEKQEVITLLRACGMTKQGGAVPYTRVLQLLGYQ